MFMPVAREDLLELIPGAGPHSEPGARHFGNRAGSSHAGAGTDAGAFMAFVERNIDAAKKARKTNRELDELYETSFRGAEVDLVMNSSDSWTKIENETDELQAVVRQQLFEMEADLPPVDVMFLYQVIELIGEIGDQAERIGRRLEILINH